MFVLTYKMTRLTLGCVAGIEELSELKLLFGITLSRRSLCSECAKNFLYSQIFTIMYYSQHLDLYLIQLRKTESYNFVYFCNTFSGVNSSCYNKVQNSKNFIALCA